MEYKDFFSPKTLEKLNKKSAENLKTMLGDKNLRQAMMSSTELVSQISQAEAPYRQQLEELAVEMVKELYPIIDEEGIVLDAKIGNLSSVGSELDEIKVNQPMSSPQPYEDIKNWGSGWLGYLIDALNETGRWKGKTNLKTLLNQHGYGDYDINPENWNTVPKDDIESLSWMLEDDWGITDRNEVKEGIKLILNFLNKYKPGDFFHEGFDPNSDLGELSQYRYIDYLGVHDRNYGDAIIASNRINIGQNPPQGNDNLDEIRVNKPFKNWKEKDEYYNNKIKKEFGYPIETEAGDYPFYNIHLQWDDDALKYDSEKGWLTPEEAYNHLLQHQGNNNLDEIQVNNPKHVILSKYTESDVYKILDYEERTGFYPEGLSEKDVIYLKQKYNIENKDDNDVWGIGITEAISPESRRRIINAITQGAALRGSFAFYLFKEHLDDLDPSLVEKYNQIMKNSFGIYDDENAIAMMLSLLAQGQKMAGGSSKVVINEAESGITIRARAINFPMLVHELIKGLYELISLQGFKGDKESNQAVVDKVDLLKNEPSDIRYGKFIYDALNRVFINSEYNDPRIREFFFTEVYQLDDDNFIEFIENAINEELTSSQQRWANDTLRDIYVDLKADDYDATGLDEIRVNKPGDTRYYLNPEFEGWLNQYYDDVRYEFDEDTADALFMFKMASEDNKTIRTSNVESLFKSEPDTWEGWGTVDRFIEFLFHYDVIQTKPSLKEIKINKPEGISKESFLEYINKNFKTPLKEYSEKTITTTIERWKTADPNTDENTARQLIQRFDQIKSGLAQKLDIISLPDELKQGNNYLNIDKYSYEDMINLIRSLPEKEEKVKKDAVKRFTDKFQIDRNTAQSYVARFMSNRKKLKFGAKEGLEDVGLTKEDILNFIPKRLQQRDAFFDPRNWDWASFEQMLDAVFPSQKQAEEEGENLVSTDADKIYDKGGIEIYKGDDVHKCISYNPKSDVTGRKKYGWCVTQVGNTNYDFYRFGGGRLQSPTFYFVFDRSKPSSPEHPTFDDQWHAFVIQVEFDQSKYVVTGADNRGDVPTDKGWEGIADIVPADTWNKIKGLKDYFKPIGLSPMERGRKFASGKNLSLSEFKELSQDEKELYIQGKASNNQISLEILKILPQYKINYEGRSTTLANIAMDNRQKFPYSILKDNEALAKRYAIVSSRHFPDDPLPLPFIKYLKEDEKEKYLKKYDENLTFEYIEKFFGDKVAEEYTNEQAKKLDYLPPSAIKYIKDPKLKQLYSVYLKLFDSWRFESGTNISEEELGNLQTMPLQSVTPIPMDQKQWSRLTTPERKTIIGLIEKFNQNTKYLTLLYALPFLIEDSGKKYVLLPKSASGDVYDTWVLVDENGRVIKDNINGETTELDNVPLENGYPDEASNYNRIYNIKDLKND